MSSGNPIGNASPRKGSGRKTCPEDSYKKRRGGKNISEEQPSVL